MEVTGATLKGGQVGSSEEEGGGLRRGVEEEGMGRGVSEMWKKEEERGVRPNGCISRGRKKS